MTDKGKGRIATGGRKHGEEVCTCTVFARWPDDVSKTGQGREPQQRLSVTPSYWFGGASRPTPKTRVCGRLAAVTIHTRDKMARAGLMTLTAALSARPVNNTNGSIS